jgi:hypothetical protein
MYGIPTQSEVSDSNYRRSFDIEKTQRDLCFFFLFSTCQAHNSMNSMLRRTEKVNTKQVLDDYVQKAESFKGRLEEARTKGYLVDRVIEGWSSVHPNIESYTYGPTGESKQKMRKRLLNEGLVRITPMTKRQVKKRFENSNCNIIEPSNYSFNPTELAFNDIETYITELKGSKGLVSRILPIVLLSNVKSVADSFSSGNNSNLGLYEHSLFEKFDWSSSIESTNGTEANILKRENELIANQSDAYLRFDEMYFIIKTGQGNEHMIPFDRILNEKDYYSNTAVDSMKKVLDSKGHILINGQQFGQEVLDQLPFERI